MTTDQKIDEVLKIVRAQGDRHERQFSQMMTHFAELKAELTAKIDRFYESLSHDISVFAGDLYRFEKRLPKKRMLP